MMKKYCPDILSNNQRVTIGKVLLFRELDCISVIYTIHTLFPPSVINRSFGRILILITTPLLVWAGQEDVA
jgi:hypothetical protein